MCCTVVISFFHLMLSPICQQCTSAFAPHCLVLLALTWNSSSIDFCRFMELQPYFFLSKFVKYISEIRYLSFTTNMVTASGLVTASWVLYNKANRIPSPVFLSIVLPNGNKLWHGHLKSQPSSLKLEFMVKLTLGHSIH